MELNKLKQSKNGVLNDEQLKTLFKTEIIKYYEPENLNQDNYNGVDASSIELHLSDKIWKMKSTAKLKKDETVRKVINLQKEEEEVNITDVLKSKNVYIIKLKEKIQFDKFNNSSGLYGRASGKSSIGRLDVLTRLIVDHSSRYDEIPPDYNGDIYLEVIPLSFNIKVKEGLSLNQLRVFKGNPELSRIRNDDLNKLAPMLYYDRGQPVLSETDILRVNLHYDNQYKSKPIAFKALNTIKSINLNKKNHNPKEYWQVVPSKKNPNDLKMIQNEFYILRSLERLLIPNDIAVTCVAYSENLGELRIHYAGFAHPNFGHFRRDKKIGAPLIFEARCHSFNVTIRHEEPFAKIEYYKMSEPYEKDEPGEYTNQELKLSNYFKDW